jgi:hypothetical protein
MIMELIYVPVLLAEFVGSCFFASLYQARDNIEQAVNLFGTVLTWTNNVHCKSHVLVRCAILHPSRVPRSLIICRSPVVGGGRAIMDCTCLLAFFFSKNTGELRFIIYRRRKKGIDPKYNPHNTTPLHKLQHHTTQHNTTHTRKKTAIYRLSRENTTTTKQPPSCYSITGG